ncbi:hypothetical protein P152DRAFT_197844 [Eremomyces bilateralis CBS 781.70]|uniref:Increased loss of mitochondrial DNA protein 1 n=1 Tax=Eremomyces bilateralis CBS 781.70 TaxID=1392243 RepID=A0A6G1GD59_9PEZI|nr:uncharacterized protein P152DRAFT_197844 [Eremomyces bilateralis CBS 781.70]KAF1815831.1 hypothetical protein P152DRAFT_197844 [Eremomyces bilateralis CBS 781.70]
MALISSFTLIRVVSVFHIFLAFVLLQNPQKVADHDLVFFLGEATHMPHATSAFSKPSHASAFLAVILAFLGVVDLSAVSMPTVLAMQYWAVQVPVRLAFLFGLTALTYMMKPLGDSKTRAFGQDLKNSVVFTWAFTELLLWYWIYSANREERKMLVVQRGSDGETAAT